MYDKVVKFTSKNESTNKIDNLLSKRVTEILAADKNNALVAIIVRDLEGRTLMSVDTTKCGYGVSTRQLRDSLCDAIKFSYDMEDEAEY